MKFSEHGSNAGANNTVASTQFPNLPVATGLTGAEIVPIVQAGTSARTTVGAIALFADTGISNPPVGDLDYVLGFAADGALEKQSPLGVVTAGVNVAPLATSDDYPVSFVSVDTDGDIRRAKVPFTVVEAFTGQSIQDACNYMSAQGGGEVYLPSGTYFISTEISIPQGVYLKGGGSSHLRASVAIVSLIFMTHGLTGVSGIVLENPAGLATCGITVAKGSDDDFLSIKIEDNYFAQFDRAINWTLGTDAIVTGNTAIDNDFFFIASDDGRNSLITGNYSLGGVGVYLAATVQQAEGVYIGYNKMFPAAGGSSAISINNGLEITIEGNIFDQIINGEAVAINAFSGPVRSVRLIGNWLGRQAGAAGANFGLYAAGNIRDIQSISNTYCGWRQSAIQTNGTAPSTLIGFTSAFDTFLDGDPSVNDITLYYSEQVLITGARFTGSASIVEGVGVTGKVSDCNFLQSTKPATISLGLRYGDQSQGISLYTTGTATVDGISKTTGLINHGLSYQPSSTAIRIFQTNFPTADAGVFIVNTVTPTQMEIISQNAGGVTSPQIAWSIDLRR